MHRRQVLAGGLAAIPAAMALGSAPAFANVPAPYDWSASPPMDDRQKFVDWMVKERGEDPKFLGERFDRFGHMVRNGDLYRDKEKRAFLMTPREAFCRTPNLPRAYADAFLDIGYGVTISGPHLVGRMTSSIDVKKGERVLEVGTGSGYQSAILANLTDQVFTIEIIKPLAARTRGVYDKLIAASYDEYKSISTENADGYYGWGGHAPFDKIIVTCGIDHIPPSLLQQLQPDGIMVIPVGPPGAQHVLKVVKKRRPNGKFQIIRSDIYHGRIVNFVPFTKLEGDKIVGTHNG